MGYNLAGVEGMVFSSESFLKMRFIFNTNKISSL